MPCKEKVAEGNADGQGGDNKICKYRTFSLNLQRELRRYVANGGALFVSGAYVASSNRSDVFIEKGLRYTLQQDVTTQNGVVYSPKQNWHYNLQTWPNTKQYFVQNLQSIMPVDADGECILYYTDSQLPAAVKVGNKLPIIVAGFPFECVIGDESRRYVMKLFLDALEPPVVVKSSKRRSRK